MHRNVTYLVHNEVNKIHNDHKRGVHVMSRCPLSIHFMNASVLTIIYMTLQLPDSFDFLYLRALRRRVSVSRASRASRLASMALVTKISISSFSFFLSSPDRYSYRCSTMNCSHLRSSCHQTYTARNSMVILELQLHTGPVLFHWILQLGTYLLHWIGKYFFQIFLLLAIQLVH